MIAFGRATVADGMAILNNLREQEAKTIKKLGIDPVALLADTLTNSQFPSYTVFVDGEPAAIFGGYSPTLLGECRLWMLTTPLIEKNQIALLRASRNYVRWMFANYGPVIGMVDAEFEKSKAWLRWIGFKEIQQGEYIVMRYSGGN